MHLLFVGDGERDACVCPKLVHRILNSAVTSEFKSWKSIRLFRGKGYERKLKFAMAQARNGDFDGVVATIDADTCEGGQGLRRLRTARNEDRQENPPVPAAVGEAVPHLEAWLLDDPKSVKDVLGLPTDRELPNVLKVPPKDTLNELCNECDRTESFLALLELIAAEHDCDRCNHSGQTGLQDFVEDVKQELGPLVA